MIRTIFTFLICLCAIPTIAGSSRYDNNHILYWDDTSHLEYMLNTDTKEAMLGSGLDDEKAAIHYPPNGDPWWDNMTNLWENIVVASSIEYEGETYIVTKVSNNAFYKSTEVRTIELPETITEIGNFAFGYCTNLERVNIPEGVKSISMGMFYVCKNLTSIHLPSTIETIGSQAFIDCVLLESINIPSNCTSVDNDAFSWCLKLSTLTIEDGIKPLNLGYAFSFGPMWQAYMEPFYYPGTFFRGLFNDCPLKNLYIGRNINFDNIGKIQSPFEVCTVKFDSSGKAIYLRSGKYYESVEFGNMVTEIHSQLFMDAQIPTIILPDSLRAVGDKAFYKAVTQPSISIPEKCDSIGNYAFVSLNNPGTLKKIDCKAIYPPRISEFSFYGQDVIVSVPEGKRDIYKKSEYWNKYFICDANDQLVDINLKYANSLYGRLSFLDLNPEDVFRLKISGILGSDDWTVISEMKNLYDLDLSDVTCENISSISSVLSHLLHFKFPKGVKIIEKNQFQGCHLTGELQIPETCERIESGAFWKAPISKLVINGPTIVEEMAFSFCTNLSEISVSGGAKLLEESFKYVMDVDNPNAGLETLTIGNDVIVEKNAFYYCTHLTNIIFDGRVASVDNGAFSDCKNIKNITFNGSISKLGGDVFDNMAIHRLDVNDLQSWCSMSFNSTKANPMAFAKDIYINGSNDFALVLPEDVCAIGNNAFYNCKGLRSLTIKGKVKQIGMNCFADCINLKNVSLSDDIENIGNGGFANCKSLTSVHLPANLSFISDSLFYGCENLTDVTIPQSVKEIRKGAFSGCKSMLKVDLPFICNSIGEKAFEKCTSLTMIKLPYNVTEIGESAFANCEGLTTVKALWETPPTVVPTSFTNVNKKCILYVPVGSVPTYYEKGWGRFPLIDEGYCMVYIKYNNYGAVKFNGDDYREFNNTIALDINSDATLTIQPDDGFYIKNLCLDGASIKPEMHSNRIELDNVTSNHILAVDFKKYVVGDVNDDDYIDVGDVSDIVRHIQKKAVENFVAIAADVNMDDEIDVGDIRGEVNLIYDYANSFMKHKMNRKQEFAYYGEMKALINNELNECFVTFVLGNTDDVSGIQMKIIIPKGWAVCKDVYGNPDVIFGKEGTSNMNIKNIIQLNDTCYQILCASTKPVCMKENENVFSLKIMSCGSDTLSDIYVPEIRISDSNANVILSSTYITVENANGSTDISNNVYNKDKINRKYIRDGHILIRTENGTYNIDGYKYNN